MGFLNIDIRSEPKLFDSVKPVINLMHLPLHKSSFESCATYKNK